MRSICLMASTLAVAAAASGESAVVVTLAAQQVGEDVVVDVMFANESADPIWIYRYGVCPDIRELAFRIAVADQREKKSVQPYLYFDFEHPEFPHHGTFVHFRKLVPGEKVGCTVLLNERYDMREAKGELEVTYRGTYFARKDGKMTEYTMTSNSSALKVQQPIKGYDLERLRNDRLNGEPYNGTAGTNLP